LQTWAAELRRRDPAVFGCESWAIIAARNFGSSISLSSADRSTSIGLSVDGDAISGFAEPQRFALGRKQMPTARVGDRGLQIRAGGERRRDHCGNNEPAHAGVAS
jgi:hypothetical protein